MDNIKQELVETKFAIGAVVKHRFLDFRGVIFDVDPEFNNTEEWYQSIPPQFVQEKINPFTISLLKMVISFMLPMYQSKTYLMTPQKYCQNILRLRIYFLILKMGDLCLSQELSTNLFLKSYLQRSCKDLHRLF